MAKEFISELVPCGQQLSRVVVLQILVIASLEMDQVMVGLVSLCRPSENN